MTNINGWRLLRRVSDSGVVCVYEAVHAERGLEGILKRQTAQADAGSLTHRFLREAAMLKQLDGQGSVQLLDEGEHDGYRFLVTERAAGVTLAERLSGAPLSHAEALSIGEALIKALLAVHAARIIHRDVKPSNIMLSDALLDGERGPQARAWLLDLGIAKVLPKRSAQSDEDDEFTAPGSLLGSPLYMAPEQLWNAEGAQEPADIYAAGACLYELFSGQAPLVRGSIEELFEAKRSAEIPPLASRSDWVPSPLALRIDAMLARRPSDRPPLTDVLSLLQDLLASTPSAATRQRTSRSFASLPLDDEQALSLAGFSAVAEAGMTAEGLRKLRASDRWGRAVTLFVVPTRLSRDEALGRIEAMRHLLRRPSAGFVEVSEELQLPSGARVLVRRGPLPPRLGLGAIISDRGAALAAAWLASQSIAALGRDGRRFDAFSSQSVRLSAPSPDALTFALMEPVIRPGASLERTQNGQPKLATRGCLPHEAAQFVLAALLPQDRERIAHENDDGLDRHLADEPAWYEAAQRVWALSLAACRRR